MRTLLTALALLYLAAPLRAAEPANEPVGDADAPLKLGQGVELPRPVYAQILAREDGLATIERIQARASDAEVFQGVPQLGVVFAGVLLFFWSAMFYYQRKHARLHATIRAFVEKGLSVPPELLRAVDADEGRGTTTTSQDAAPPVWASNLMWGGLLWVTIGVCGVIYLWLRGNDAWPWGFAAVVYGASSMITGYRRNKARC